LVCLLTDQVEIMILKNLQFLVFGDGSDELVVEAAEGMDALRGAHCAFNLMFALPEPIVVGDGLGSGIVLSEIVDQVQKDALEAQRYLRSRLQRTDLAFEDALALGQALTLCEGAAMRARHCDLTIAVRPSHGSPGLRRDVLETVLMESGRPLLLLPPEWSVVPRFRKIFIAWNASREAARAVADALAFLHTANTISVGTIDARPAYRGHGQLPGADIATHLARRGLQVDLRNLDSLGADKGDAITRAAHDAGADLIVMGGYGHARLQESIFGGVTRTLFESCALPLFLSH
jgi:nucleotide-binding universal stress UspA family protein